MNATAQASACRRLGRELRTEAQRWRRLDPSRFRRLCHAALQLAHTANSVNEQPLGVVEAVIDAAQEVLIVAMTDRAIASWEAHRG